MSVVKAIQMRQYEENGYLLLSGLIDRQIVSDCLAILWRTFGADPDNAATWSQVPRTSGGKVPEMVACFTPQVCAAAAEVANEGLPALPAPSSAYTLNVLPQDGPWKADGPHIDHALEKDGHHVFPRPMRAASIIYLNDVPEDGAPTVIWPGSHKKIESLAQSDHAHYDLMMTLNRDLRSLDLGEPVRILARQGDILFYHYLTAHCGSRNARSQPRLALAHKW